jgi:predicted ATPase/DNA-binding XRE family transcriptional regulator
MAGAGSAFGAMLRRLRLAASLTQEGLAERAGVSAKAVGELERDAARLPRLETVALLADALGLGPDDRARLVAAARPDQLSPDDDQRSAPSGLPSQLTPLFGREADAVAVLGALRDGARWVTLTGPGGVGKTRLAIAAAQLAEADFPDGVTFVDLAPVRDPDLVAAAIARRLGLAERGETPLAERLATALRRKRMLLLLDNFEHLMPARDAMLALLGTCPHLTLLVTSREAGRVRGEREVRVSPLALPAGGVALTDLADSPAVALFLDRAAAVGGAPSAAALPAVAAICRRLDGLPLAIELAATWTRLIPPLELLARLDRRLAVLIDGPADLPDRQRTMRQAIAWSYNLLDVGQQTLFRSLCVFSGGFTPDAARVMVGIALEADLLSDLAALLDRSLIQSMVGANGTTARLTILETLRDYGLERLEEAAEAAVVRRAHAACFLALATSGAAHWRTAEGAAWARRLDAEHDNLRSALTWVLADGDADLALRFAAALWPFWSDRGHLGEGRRWVDAALDLADGEGAADAIRATALVGAARLAVEHGAFEEAARRLVQAEPLTRSLPTACLETLLIAGRLAWERNAYAEAERCYAEAGALAHALGDPASEAAAGSGFGFSRIFSGDPVGGAARCNQAVALARAAGDRRALIESLAAAAGAAMHVGAFEPAEAMAVEALTLARDLGDAPRVADSLWVLGTAYLSLEREHLAAEVFAENVALLRDHGDERGTIQPLTALGLVALRLGDRGRARAWVEEAAAVVERFPDQWSRAMSGAARGHVALAEDDPTTAVAQFATAIPLFREIANPAYLPWCVEGLAGVAAASGSWELAARLLGAHDALVEEWGGVVPPVNPRAVASLRDRARAILGDEAVVRAQADGRTMSPEEAVVAVGAIAEQSPTRQDFA